MEYLGIGCINVCRYYDPKIILLSGGILAGEQLLTMTTEAFLRHHWYFQANMWIKFATTGNEAGAIGAAYSAYLKVN